MVKLNPLYTSEDLTPKLSVKKAKATTTGKYSFRCATNKPMATTKSSIDNFKINL